MFSFCKKYPHPEGVNLKLGLTRINVWENTSANTHARSVWQCSASFVACWWLLGSSIWKIWATLCFTLLFTSVSFSVHYVVRMGNCSQVECTTLLVVVLVLYSSVTVGLVCLCNVSTLLTKVKLFRHKSNKSTSNWTANCELTYLMLSYEYH